MFQLPRSPSWQCPSSEKMIASEARSCLSINQGDMNTSFRANGKKNNCSYKILGYNSYVAAIPGSGDTLLI
jgi:hypothetical protein